MTDLIVVAVVLIVLGLVTFYIIRAKKQGQKCIGCPHSKQCASLKQGSCCSCSNNESSNK